MGTSCDPNRGFDGPFAVRALRAIPAGEELTVDYATCSGPGLVLDCRCGGWAAAGGWWGGRLPRMGEPAAPSETRPRRSSTWARARAWAHGLVVHGLPERRAALIGAVAVGLVSVAVHGLEDELGRPAQALLLVVPVAATAALGGRRPALAVPRWPRWRSHWCCRPPGRRPSGWPTTWWP